MNEPPKPSNGPVPAHFNWHTIIGVALTVLVWTPILIAAIIAFVAR
jgi:hypothetical protein